MIINDYKGGKRERIKRLLGIKPKGAWFDCDPQKYKSDFEKENTEKLRTVQIETFNRCNGECAFCPVNKFSDTRKPLLMSETLFVKILTDLSNIDFDGRVALFSNNEPSLDDRIVIFAKLAREYLPNAYIYIFSNGSRLNVEKCRELVKYLDELRIDNYNDELTLNPNIEAINDACLKDKRMNAVVRIHLRKQNEVLFSRGGQAPNNAGSAVRDYPCFLPFNQMVIRPDGKVSLCCSDALGKMTMGDVSVNSVMEVWKAVPFEKVRKTILENKIDSIELCKYCDSKQYK